MKNRYDIVYSNDKNQNEKLLSLSLSSYLFSKPSNFPVSFRLEQSPRFLRYKKLPTYVHTVVARVQNHSFRLYWTRPRSPIIRKRLERTLQNVIASFSSFLISPLLFPPQSFSQHVIPTTFAQNQVDIQSETKEDVYNCTRLLYDRSPESVTFLAQISLFLLIPFIFPRRDYTLMPFEWIVTILPYSKISKFPNQYHFWYIRFELHRVIDFQFFFIRKKIKKKIYPFRSNNSELFVFDLF